VISKSSEVISKGSNHLNAPANSKKPATSSPAATDEHIAPAVVSKEFSKISVSSTGSVPRLTMASSPTAGFAAKEVANSTVKPEPVKSTGESLTRTMVPLNRDIPRSQQAHTAAPEKSRQQQAHAAAPEKSRQPVSGIQQNHNQRSSWPPASPFSSPRTSAEPGEQATDSIIANTANAAAAAAAAAANARTVEASTGKPPVLKGNAWGNAKNNAPVADFGKKKPGFIVVHVTNGKDYVPKPRDSDKQSTLQHSVQKPTAQLAVHTASKIGQVTGANELQLLSPAAPVVSTSVKRLYVDAAAGPAQLGAVSTQSFEAPPDSACVKTLPPSRTTESDNPSSLLPHQQRRHSSQSLANSSQVLLQHTAGPSLSSNRNVSKLAASNASISEDPSVTSSSNQSNGIMNSCFIIIVTM
jgi:hypothetical protein